MHAAAACSVLSPRLSCVLSPSLPALLAAFSPLPLLLVLCPPPQAPAHGAHVLQPPAAAGLRRPRHAARAAAAGARKRRGLWAAVRLRVRLRVKRDDCVCAHVCVCASLPGTSLLQPCSKRTLSQLSSHQQPHRHPSPRMSTPHVLAAILLYALRSPRACAACEAATRQTTLLLNATRAVKTDTVSRRRQSLPSAVAQLSSGASSSRHACHLCCIQTSAARRVLKSPPTARMQRAARARTQQAAQPPAATSSARRRL